MMTAPTKFQVSAYRINGCRSIRLQMAKTCLQRVIAIPRSEAVTAGQKWHTTSWDHAILPAKGTAPRRVMESIATRVFGPRRASRGPKTAGPTRPVQSGTHRKAPARALGFVGTANWDSCSSGPGARRAVDTPRPGGPVMRPAASSATARTADRRDRPPPLTSTNTRLSRSGVGCTYPPTLPSRGTQMPYMLRFHDTDDGTELPDPAQVGHAAAWAAERGYWDVATCLMELAHALAELEPPTPAPIELPRPWSAVVADDDAWTPDPRYVDQAAPHPESRLTEALARAKPDVVPPACSDHGQPMLQGLRLEDGTYDWHCVCVLPRRM